MSRSVRLSWVGMIAALGASSAFAGAASAPAPPDFPEVCTLELAPRCNVKPCSDLPWALGWRENSPAPAPCEVRELLGVEA